jgi:hypothetical protein
LKKITNKASQSDGFFVTCFAVYATLRYHKTIHYKAAAACGVRGQEAANEISKRNVTKNTCLYNTSTSNSYDRPNSYFIFSVYPNLAFLFKSES